MQTLFADLASGARASAMVSQGRVGALVAAKPEERRAVLEEAAGITGLHARRHEAELKLRAAETNLSRAEDLRGQLETQLGSLKRQARQASRYRNISGAIRTAEAELLAILRARAEQDRAAARSRPARRARRSVAEAAQPVAATQAAATRNRRGAAAAAGGRSGRPHRRWNATASRGSIWRPRKAAPGRLWPKRAAGWRNCAPTWGTPSRSAPTPWPPRPGCVAEDAASGGGRRRPSRSKRTRRRPRQSQAADQARAAEREANRATEAAAEANAQAQSALQAMAQAEQRVRRLMEQLARVAGRSVRRRRPAGRPATSGPVGGRGRRRAGCAG